MEATAERERKRKRVKDKFHTYALTHVHQHHSNRRQWKGTKLESVMKLSTVVSPISFEREKREKGGDKHWHESTKLVD